MTKINLGVTLTYISELIIPHTHTHNQHSRGRFLAVAVRMPNPISKCLGSIPGSGSSPPPHPDADPGRQL